MTDLTISIPDELAEQIKMPSDRFLRDFESGAIDEDPNDWLAFYHWRSLCYGLKHMEEQYGFKSG